MNGHVDHVGCWVDQYGEETLLGGFVASQSMKVPCPCTQHVIIQRAKTFTQ